MHGDWCSIRHVKLYSAYIQPKHKQTNKQHRTFIVYIWFTHLRSLNKGNLSDPQYLFTTLLGLWLLFNIVFNYLSAVFVHGVRSQELFPKNTNASSNGPIQIQVLTPLMNDNDTNTCGNDDKIRTFIQLKNDQIIKDYFFNEPNLDSIRGLRNNPYIWRYCNECNLPKPPRAHHCSICQQCVLNMDHHWFVCCTYMF